MQINSLTGRWHNQREREIFQRTRCRVSCEKFVEIYLYLKQQRIINFLNSICLHLRIHLYLF